MHDPYNENFRKKEVIRINKEIESSAADDERKRLEAVYGQVWNTEELQRDFTVSGFLAPFVSVIRKSDGQRGSLEFQHLPRFYFNFLLT